MPARKPTNLKKLAGTDRPDRARGNEPTPEVASSLRAPPGLSKEAAAFWRKHATELRELGLLTTLDLGSFTLMAWSFGFALQAAAIVVKDGMLRLDENGIERKHPALQVFRDQSSQFMTWAREFGLTPVARGRIDAKPPGGDPVSEFMAYLTKGAELREKRREDGKDPDGDL